MANNLRIIADYREFQSGIPTMLLNRKVETKLENLLAGDYLVNDQILIERKTAEDFIQSIISNRLFYQCGKMKRKTIYHLLIIIEGNPYATSHNISHESIKGALLSVSSSWQIPVVFSQDKNETSDLLISIGNQMLHDKIPNIRRGYKPKKMKNQQLYLLQGLPEIGPALAYRLLLHFGSIKKIMRATEKQLLMVDGIGKTKALKIVEFINEIFDNHV